ncbi:nuclear transport factor 2 family protein [Undibacterium arcticum]
MPRDLQYLLDRADISDLLIDYGNAIDTRDFAALERIFTADAVIDYRATGGPRCTLAEAQAFLGQALPQFPRSQHMMANIRIRLEGECASARTMCHNPMVMRHPDGSERVMFFSVSGTTTRCCAPPTAGASAVAARSFATRITTTPPHRRHSKCYYATRS